MRIAHLLRGYVTLRLEAAAARKSTHVCVFLGSPGRRLENHAHAGPDLTLPFLQCMYTTSHTLCVYFSLGTHFAHFACALRT